MILRVVDHVGAVVHDCKRDGCEVSWDGFDIRTGDRVEGHAGVHTPHTRKGSDTAQLPAPPK